MNNTPERLNKKLALWLGISRRQADDLIAAGKVFVDNDRAVLGQRVTADNDIKVDGKAVSQDFSYKLIALNKPTGYTCSRASQKGDQTVYDILPAEFKTLKLVGRLDKDSSGIILLTNNGNFAYQMTHPKFQKAKVYLVELDHDLEPLHQQMISDHGINLDDGRSQMTVVKLTTGEIKALRIDYEVSDKQVYQVTMSEGRNRQIRRTFAALGYEVTRLHRTNFDKYFVGELSIGQWQEAQF